MKLSDEWLLSEKVYLSLTFWAKTAKVVLRCWVGRGLLGMNLCLRPRSCLVPVDGGVVFAQIMKG